MIRISITLAIATTLWVSLTTSSALAQSEAQQRQAAAEAYDLGTAAYLSGEFEKAGEWFETAHRMSPAAPALQQAATSYEKAGDETRAASLALRLTLEYPDNTAANDYATDLLDRLSERFVRIDVVCDECRLELDGTLQEFPSFFIEPDSDHTIIATFEHGQEEAVVRGEAGGSRTIEFEAPLPPISEPSGPTIEPPASRDGRKVDMTGKPLPPLATYIGAGLTGALLAASIVSTVDMLSGVDPYEDAAQAYEECAQTSANCDALFDEANDLLEEGQQKETRTTVLWIAAGGAAAATGVMALFLTDWSDGDDDAVSLRVTPLPGGAYTGLRGRF